MSPFTDASPDGPADPLRVAVLSLHTSPLVQPGGGDAGGMNVYVREMVGALAQVGVDTTVYVRRWHPELADEVAVEPGFRVVHVDAGPPAAPKEELAAHVDTFADRVAADLTRRGGVRVLHANYWLSGVAGHRLKHELDLPLVSTFHTLARVKAETGDPEPARRVAAEAAVVACSDVIIANAVTELRQLVELYGADPTRVEVLAPGVDHATFSPGSRAGARAALGVDERPLLVFAGRIQPLKGVDIAVSTLAHLDHDARLVIIGGASGPAGEAELARIRHLIAAEGLEQRVTFVAPCPHHVLSTYYRAADVVLVPSRSESFGLVALEAAACGTPVVAADVGGLRTLVDDGRTGFLIGGRDPALYAGAVARILDDPTLAARLSRRAVETAARYTWSSMARRLRRIYAELACRTPVDCLA